MTTSLNQYFKKKHERETIKGIIISNKSAKYVVFGECVKQQARDLAYKLTFKSSSVDIKSGNAHHSR